MDSLLSVCVVYVIYKYVHIIVFGEEANFPS